MKRIAGAGYRVVEVRAHVMILSTTALCAIVFAFCLFSCRSTLVTSDDATLQERIVDNLHGDHLDSITVVVSHGRATLEGTAPSAAAREAARRDAEQIEGVKAVVNNVQVQKEE